MTSLNCWRVGVPRTERLKSACRVEVGGLHDLFVVLNEQYQRNNSIPFYCHCVKNTTEVERGFSQVLKHTMLKTRFQVNDVKMVSKYERRVVVLWKTCICVTDWKKIQTDSNLLTFNNDGCRMMKWSFKWKLKTKTSSVWCTIIISESDERKLT